MLFDSLWSPTWAMLFKPMRWAKVGFEYRFESSKARLILG